jgi:hypothetical protein
MTAASRLKPQTLDNTRIINSPFRLAAPHIQRADRVERCAPPMKMS